MPRHYVKPVALMLALASGTAVASVSTPTSAPQSVNVLKFGDNNTLFVGDSQSAMLYAYTPKSVSNPLAQKGYNLHDLGHRISVFAKVPEQQILVRDMAINPVSKEAYIAFDSKTKKGYTSQVVVVDQTGTVKPFDLKNETHASVKLTDAPTDPIKFWGETPMRSFTFTDIDYYKGKVYVSGMSNAEFSSALRVIDYPFTPQSKVSTSSIEIFHTVHAQNETRAPIQTMQFVTLNNVDYILAAYTCTPLVLIQVSDLKDGAHIIGKTIAEMGYGNTPVDLIKFKSAGFDKVPYEGVILANKNRTAQFVNLADVAASAKKESIAYAGMVEHAGTPISNLPLTGLMQLDDQDDYHIATIGRNADTGQLELLSYLKNVYLRLDQFVSEYDQPSYVYKGQQLDMKGMQNMMIKDIDQNKYIKP